jgi:predicted NUDIX family phosphoesterase
VSGLRFVLVIERKLLFPGLSPQGFLPLERVEFAKVQHHAFFAERDAMEQNSHFKQLIPYMALELGDEVLAYQRQSKHSEQRLGGLWTIGFGGHVEPIDREDPRTREFGLLRAAAMRELAEETGLALPASALRALGYINSESTDVSSVHFGLFFAVDLRPLGLGREAIAARVEAQAEPHRVAWMSRRALAQGAPPPDGGSFEDWTRCAVEGLRG